MALPAITVSRLDVARLEALLATAHGEVAEGLEEELLRATVVAPEAMPADVVTMNSRIRCREQGRGREMSLTLVYPQDSGPEKVSVLAPVGAALLGLSVGQSIDWPAPNGKTLKLEILAIEYQPEANGEDLA
ncbi:transcription elongation factor GreAB [Alcanivorax sp. HI0083]|uniref:nucleoside diphosphate kinase regulator n=1 Tax=unclassified Alcanivorax TaxID=2638842 RepID=UPI0007B901BF|nr:MULTISPECIES: nucleoside diphosphate kinase regulator [unclassified Alcanivorax]KZY36177.1 transcription elongation factor GreAB [Alcanivorax sp. HI0044]KZZ27874.1 transcription elongation factor GreAB [Alcanivorax sp. HI0083]PHR68116.1 MAG: transcription elongation factor GreAB [Alcanivorax sp.]